MKRRGGKRRGLRGLQGVTKRDFVAVAVILRSNGASCRLTRDMANYFARQNPQFDRERFTNAAGCD